MERGNTWGETLFKSLILCFFVQVIGEVSSAILCVDKGLFALIQKLHHSQPIWGKSITFRWLPWPFSQCSGGQSTACPMSTFARSYNYPRSLPATSERLGACQCAKSQFSPVFCSKGSILWSSWPWSLLDCLEPSSAATVLLATEQPGPDAS